jgi:hypothetical protein
MNLKKVFVVSSVILVVLILLLFFNFSSTETTEIVDTNRAVVEHTDFGNCARDKAGRLVTYPADLNFESIQGLPRSKILSIIAKTFLPGNWEELSIEEQKLFLEKAECPIFRESTRSANITEEPE